jgi:transcriptional regulator with XRE-family HTH domain
MPQKNHNKNPLLSVIKQMAKNRDESLQDFADRFSYSPETIEQLEKNPWFNPSTRTIYVLWKELAIYRREENAIVRLAEAVHQQDDATKKEEFLHLYDSLPIDFRHSLMDHIRQEVEDHFVRKD